MPGTGDPPDADVEEMQSTLSDGLKACRAVVRGYRQLMIAVPGSAAGHPPADNDQPAGTRQPD